MILIAVAGFIIYSNALHNQFVFDDKYFIVDNPCIRNLKNIPSFFTSVKSFGPTGNFYIYRPLSTLSYAVDYALGKLDPVIFHLSSVLWHVLTCIMLYLVLNHVLEDRTASFLGALLFTVHPVQTESVVWPAQTSNLISLFFFLLSFYLWLENFSAASLASFAFALLGKEIAITLPLILMLYDARTGPGIRKRIKSYAPFFAIAVLYVILRTTVVGRISGQDAYPGGSIYTAMLTTAKAVVLYIRLLFLPAGLCVDHRFVPVKSGAEGGAIGSLVFVIAVLCSGVVLFRKRRRESFFIFWFFLTLLPVSNIIPLQNVLVAERFVYFPAAGFCGLISVLFIRICRNEAGGRVKNAAAVFMSFLIIFYGYLTMRRNSEWKDALTLWNATLKENPLSYRAYGDRGVAYERAGRYEEAVESYEEALRLEPGFFLTHANLGVVYFKSGRYNEAIECYKEALRLSPGYARAYFNLGVVYGKMGRYKEEIECYKEALRFCPADSDAHYNLGLAYVRDSRNGDAVESFKKAIRIRSDYAESYNNLGVAYSNLGKYDDAIASWKKALRLSPDNAEGHYNLGMTYVRTGDRGSAVKEYEILKNLDRDLSARLFKDLYR